MRRHARSDGRRPAITAAAAEPMPSVGARRSTRVFVSKAIATSPPSPSPAARASRVLRSGKRFSALNGNVNGGEEIIRMLNGGEFNIKRQKRKSFGIVYSRKRRKTVSGSDISSVSPNCAIDSVKRDGKYGIIYSRRQKLKRRKRAQVSGLSLSSVTITLPDSVREFATNKGFLVGRGDKWTVRCHGAPLLTLLVGSSQGLSLFEGFVLSVLGWMRRSVAKVWELAVFLLSGPIADVFSLAGVHILPLHLWKDTVIPWNAVSGSCGVFKIYGAQKFIPIMMIGFLALPSYFQSLASTVHLRSLFKPAIIRILYNVSMGLDLHESDYLLMEVDEDDDDELPQADMKIDLTGLADRSEITVAEVDLQGAMDASLSLAQDARIVHDSRLRKHQRKRSSLRHTRKYQRLSSLKTNSVGSSAKQNSNRSVLQTKSTLCTSDLALESPRLKPLEISLDLVNGADDSDISTPIASLFKQRRPALKSPLERTVEKHVLQEARQNIDSVHCKANILVVQADRCWREEGAEVTLEYTDANKWFIAIKMQGTVRICYKPQDLRPCVVNRYTHAYMWTGEEGWKLEFMEKWDWALFKEIHSECRERNSQSKIIPIPGVQEVVDYGEFVTEPFYLPDEYIRMNDDEIGAALSNDNSLYDVDSGDEEWLVQLNRREVDVNNETCHLSTDDLEKMITAFEKDAFKYPEEAGDLDRVLERYPDFAQVHLISTIYDYWINKRNKKGAALIRVFQQWAPVRRAQLTQKPFSRKKRSLKKQKSQSGRGKTEVFLQDTGEDDAIRRVQEAENAANLAVENAIRLRNRAQLLMEIADVATYKSFMALRIAEAALTSNSSPDLIASIID